MKYFIVSCLLLASGVFAQDNGDDCKVCEYGIKIFFSHVTSDQGTRFQIATLSKDVCPMLEDRRGCDRGVGLHWSGMNHVIYGDGHYICNSITGSNCTYAKPDGSDAPLFDTKAWTCDDCMREVALVATQYTLPHVTQFLVRMLSNEAYCADPALGLSQHEVDVCSEYVHAFMGPAFRGLDAAYVGNAQAICHYWYDGVCNEPRNSKMFPMK